MNVNQVAVGDICTLQLGFLAAEVEAEWRNIKGDNQLVLCQRERESRAIRISRYSRTGG